MTETGFSDGRAGPFQGPEALRALLSAAPDAVIALDHDGRVTLWNPAAERMFGWTEAEVLGRPVPHLPPEADEEHARFRARVARGEAFSNLDVVRLHRDGTRIPVRLATAPIRDAGGAVRGVVSISTDVSEQKRAESTLLRREEYFRTLTENSSDLITILSLDGTMLYASPSVVRILGFQAHELIGSNALDRVHSDDLERVQTELARLLEQDGSATLRYRHLHADGSWRVLESVVKNLLHDTLVAGVVANTRDITDRVAAEEQNRRLAAIVQASSDAILSVSVENGEILSWNPGAEQVFGWSAEEVVGRSIFRLVPPELRWESEHIRRQMLAGAGVERLETTRRRKDGQQIPVSLSSAPIRDDSGRVTAAAVVVRDITEQKRTERDLRLAMEAAESASRAKSGFLSSMSHELRTPLNSVIGFANVLRRNPEGSLTARDLVYLDRIAANGEHLLGLINDILDLSKIEAGRMGVELQSVDLRTLVDDTLADLRSALHPGVTLEACAPQGLAPLRTDPRKLRQVLINLIGNAIKFTPAGGITVSVVADSERRPLRIDVVDTGIGIPEERLSSIFQAFEQAESGTARRFGGTGLGLAISASLARLLGYRIEARSRPGQGSTFALLLADAGAATDPGWDDAAGQGGPS